MLKGGTGFRVDSDKGLSIGSSLRVSEHYYVRDPSWVPFTIRQQSSEIGGQLIRIFSDRCVEADSTGPS